MQTTYTATIDNRGRFTFPIELRRSYNIKAGDKASITPDPKNKDTYIITILPQHN